MSVVTNVILTCSIDDAGIAQVNSWLKEHCYGQSFGPHIEGSGGIKCVDMNVYVAGFNYLDHDGFAEAVRKAPWQYPQDVQVFMGRSGERLIEIAEAAR